MPDQEDFQGLRLGYGVRKTIVNITLFVAAAYQVLGGCHSHRLMSNFYFCVAEPQAEPIGIWPMESWTVVIHTGYHRLMFNFNEGCQPRTLISHEASGLFGESDSLTYCMERVRLQNISEHESPNERSARTLQTHTTFLALLGAAFAPLPRSGRICMARSLSHR